MTSADSLRQVLLRSSHSVRKASQGKGTIFLVIYPPHLHREFRIAWGFSLCCNLTHSHMPDAVPVRRTNGLPRASFRFHLTMDTLAFGYALGAIPWGVSGFLCLGRLFQGQPNEAALCI